MSKSCVYEQLERDIDYAERVGEVVVTLTIDQAKALLKERFRLSEDIPSSTWTKNDSAYKPKFEQKKAKK